MKSFTRIGLPILLVVGVVFGITFIRNYSPEDTEGDKPGSGTLPGVAAREPALRIGMTKAVVGTPTSTPKHLWYWDSTVEVGAPGHFEFWCENRHSQPVKVNVSATNCQCAGAEMAVVPSLAYRDYTVLSALSGSLLFHSPMGPLAALAHVNFEKQLTWNTLIRGAEHAEQSVPAAESSASPQFALVRLAWTGKGDAGVKTISAQVYSGIGDEIPAAATLSVETAVVPAFDVLHRDGSEWVAIREIQFGELRENGIVKQTIYLASGTRPYFLFKVTNERPDPCITVTDPVPASEEELAAIQAQVRGKEQALRSVKCFYKVELTVRERTESIVDGKRTLHQLDLGPIDRKINIVGVDAGTWNIALKGRVLGDVTILSGADTGRIDLGNSFAADQNRTKDVLLIADRPGLDLELVDNEINPNYLKVKLEPIEQTRDGRKQWRLRVTVPKGTLFGSMPDSSGIVLRTTGPSPRRMRIPVRGMTFDAGGPRL